MTLRSGDRVGLGLIRAISYGGGVQSTALLVMAAQRDIDFRLAIFANTGDDSEHPDTLRYVREIAAPYAKANGIELAMLNRTKRDGTVETLLGRLMADNRSIGIPMRMSNSGAPGNRNCTLDFKVRVVAKELKRLGATADQPAVVALGISLDEFHRMRSDSGIPHETLTYPLIDLRLDRSQCVGIIERAGLPVPPKSSCWFCPYHRLDKWRDMARNEPELFAKSAELERMLNERRATLGKDPVWLTTALRPIDEVISDDGQARLFDDDGASCDIGGYCFA